MKIHPSTPHKRFRVYSVVDRGPSVAERQRYVGGYTSIHLMSREDAERAAEEERQRPYIRPGSVEVREEKE